MTKSTHKCILLRMNSDIELQCIQWAGGVTIYLYCELNIGLGFALEFSLNFKHNTISFGISALQNTSFRFK